MIKLSKVSKSYTTHPFALQDISFEIAQGQIVYVLGESGSGKSTLLKVIAGLEDADRGEILVNNESITGPSQNLVPGFDDIAYVPQDFKLQQYWTVGDNIGKKISHYPTDSKNERIEELLSLCKLEDHADRYPRELSGGQQQRIAMAAAIADEPELVLLDEPFSNLDLPMKSAVRKEVIEMLQTLGITLMLVSHDPAEAMAVADSIILLKGGQLEQMASPEHLYRKPKSYYAANFLGPANILLVDQRMVIARPESIRISSSGIHRGKVLLSVFMGMHYHIYLSTSISESNLLAYAEKGQMKGETVRFNIV